MWQGLLLWASLLVAYVCHGDYGGPRRHPCRRVQEALRAAGIAYKKVTFEADYGTKKNAFGKCVSETAEAS